MSIALERLQSRQAIVSQPVLRQHSTDSFSQHLRTAQLLHQPIHRDGLEATGPRVVPVVHLLPALLARGVQLRAVGDDHVVAAVR